MKNKIFSAVKTALLVAVVATATAFAADSGSSDNPLASKSYVDDKIDEVKALIATGDSTSTVTSTGGGDTYEPVYVSVGQTLYGAEGTELILRAGKGTVVLSGVDGIVDASTGSDLKSGASAVKNHIMIVPRNDGRGIRVTEAAWFLIKGDYSIS